MRGWDVAVRIRTSFQLYQSFTPSPLLQLAPATLHFEWLFPSLGKLRKQEECHSVVRLGVQGLRSPLSQPSDHERVLKRNLHAQWRAASLCAQSPAQRDSEGKTTWICALIQSRNSMTEASAPDAFMQQRKQSNRAATVSGRPFKSLQPRPNMRLSPTQAHCVPAAAAQFSAKSKFNQGRSVPSRASQAFSIRGRHSAFEVSLHPHPPPEGTRGVTAVRNAAQSSQIATALVAAQEPKGKKAHARKMHNAEAASSGSEPDQLPGISGGGPGFPYGGSRGVGPRAQPELAQKLLEQLGLNDEQMAAATSDIELPKMILAGAGTGKTTTLIGRMIHIIVGKGIPPHRVLVVTFTNKAAKELKQRLKQLGEIDISGITVATFHSVCYQIVREHWREAGFTAQPLIWGTDSELRAVLKEAMRWGALAAARSRAGELLGLADGTNWPEILAAVEQLHPTLFLRAKIEADAEMAKHRSKARGTAAKKTKTKDGVAGAEADNSASMKPSDQKATGGGFEDAMDARVSMITLISYVYEELKAQLQRGYRPKYTEKGQIVRVGDPPSKAAIKETWEWLGRQKRLGNPPHQFPEGSQERTTYAVYQLLLRQANALDFDDLLIIARDLARGEPEIRDKLRRRFQYMLVDEFQDSNPLQVALMNELQRDNGRVTVVGDDCQAIYGFRGTAASVFSDFESVYGHDSLLQSLQDNYRSRPAILTTSCKVLEASRDVIRKELRSTKPATEGKVALCETGHPGQEAEEIAKEAKRLHTEEHVPYESMAVLFRNFRTPMGFAHRKLQEAFVLHGVKFHVIRGRSLLDAATVKDTLAYLRLILNPRDDAAFERIINKPPRGLGGKLLERLQEHRDNKRWATQQGSGEGDQGADVSLMASLRELLAANAMTPRHAKGARGFAELIEQLREESQRLDPCRVLLRILVDSGYLDGYRIQLKKQAAALEEQAANPLATKVYASDDEEDEFNGYMSDGGGETASAQDGASTEESYEDLPSWVHKTDPLRSLLEFARVFIRDWEPSPSLAWNNELDNDNLADYDADEANLVTALSRLSTEDASGASAADPWQNGELRREGHAPLLDFMTQLSLSSDQDGEDGSQEGIAISTIHAAKGLEWDYVWVPRLNNLFLPTGWRAERGLQANGAVQLSLPRGPSHNSLDVLRAPSRPGSEMNPLEAACMAHFEEERRLLHVACTRAREGLYLAYVRRWGVQNDGQFLRAEPSYFLGDIMDTVELRRFPPDSDERGIMPTRRVTEAFRSKAKLC